MTNGDIRKLIFVYNADVGLRNKVIDSVHKLVSPHTYECNLCDITYGVFTENRDWKRFREAKGIAMEFLHKDEFRKTYASKFGSKFTYPVVLAATDDAFELFIDTETLNGLEGSKALMALVEERLARLS